MKWTTQVPVKEGWYFFRKETGLSWVQLLHVRPRRGVPSLHTWMARGSRGQAWMGPDEAESRATVVAGSPGFGYVEYFGLDAEHFRNGKWAGPICMPD